MKDIEQLTQDYIAANEIRFELRAINGDDEVILKYTNQCSASHLEGDARKLDEYIQVLVVADQQDKADLYAEEQMQNAMDRKDE